jgi:hypothetical protein
LGTCSGGSARNFTGTAISINNELAGGANNTAEIYGNIIAGNGYGIRMLNSGGVGGWTSIDIKHNTFISNQYNWYINSSANLLGTVTITGNLAIAHGDYGSADCNAQLREDGGMDYSSWTIEKNHWYPVFSNADWDDETIPQQAAADPNMGKTSAWDTTGLLLLVYFQMMIHRGLVR